MPRLVVDPALVDQLQEPAARAFGADGSQSRTRGWYRQPKATKGGAPAAAQPTRHVGRLVTSSVRRCTGGRPGEADRPSPTARAGPATPSPCGPAAGPPAAPPSRPGRRSPGPTPARPARGSGRGPRRPAATRWGDRRCLIVLRLSRGHGGKPYSTVGTPRRGNPPGPIRLPVRALSLVCNSGADPAAQSQGGLIGPGRRSVG